MVKELYLNKAVIFHFLNLFIFNWRIITLQYCDGFCHTSAWISHRLMSPSSWTSFPPPPQNCYTEKQVKSLWLLKPSDDYVSFKHYILASFVKQSTGGVAFVNILKVITMKHQSLSSSQTSMVCWLLASYTDLQTCSLSLPPVCSPFPSSFTMRNQEKPETRCRKDEKEKQTNVHSVAICP